MGDSRVHNRNLEAKSCHHQGGNQVFMTTSKGEIREKKFCLDATKAGEPVKMLDCHGEGGNQYWSYDENVSALFLFGINTKKNYIFLCRLIRSDTKPEKIV